MVKYAACHGCGAPCDMTGTPDQPCHGAVRPCHDYVGGPEWERWWPHLCEGHWNIEHYTPEEHPEIQPVVPATQEN